MSTTAATAPLLEARGLGRRAADGRWLLRDIDLQLEAGERVAIAGPSGGGKTLLLRALALLDAADAGHVLWRGEETPGNAVPAFRAGAMYLHQRPAVWEGTVELNLRRPFSLAVHQSKRYARDAAVDLLQRCGRDEAFLSLDAGDLSGGETQLLALVRAMLLQPQVLLLDEPTAALDRETTRLVEQALLDWHEESSERAFLWISHDAKQAQRVAQRTVKLEGGRLAGEA